MQVFVRDNDIGAALRFAKEATGNDATHPAYRKPGL
jgi:hypothetical protein